MKVYNANITEVELEKQILNAWTNDNMLKFLTDPATANLKRPRSKQMEFEEVCKVFRT